VAIGNFDGVHRGHRAVLEPTVSSAQMAGRPALALTFEPHPRTFFRPQSPVFRLTPSDVKADLLAELGFDATVELTFNAALAGLAPEDFVARILIDLFGVGNVVIGHDFHYGKARGGTPETLIAEGRRHGFEVTVVAAAGEGETLFSSSAVRTLLAEGRVNVAAEILGYDWFVRGEVVGGARRGRELGFPTANLRLPENCELRHGVYAVRVRTDSGEHEGVASFGRRPQFDNGAPLLEANLFDFAGDLYGCVIEVAFIAFLREEARFSSVDALVEQMNDDAGLAREVLARGNKSRGSPARVRDDGPIK
jgi:riboflavin kinase / FMN adenylyltransferase